MNQTHQPSKVPPLASDEKTEVALQKGMKLKKFPNSSEKSLSLCHYEPCLIALNFINGKHICPRCRRGFCHFHWKTGEFQIKISVDGKYDPIYGTFKSVCYPCFKDRPCLGNPDDSPIRDRFEEYQSSRTNLQAFHSHHDSDNGKSRIDLLEARFDKLISLDVERLSSKSRKSIERKICEWKEDESASECLLCHEPFSLLTRRKHHCRLCGNLCCSDCLLSLNPFVDYPTPIIIEDEEERKRLEAIIEGGKSLKSTVGNPSGSVAFAIRACLKCYQDLSSKLLEEKVYRPFFEVYQRLYDEFYLLKNQLLLYPENIFLLQGQLQQFEDQSGQSGISLSSDEVYMELYEMTKKLKSQIIEQFLQVSHLVYHLESHFLQPEKILISHPNERENKESGRTFSTMTTQLKTFKKLVQKILDFHKKFLKIQKITFKTFPPLSSLSPSAHSSNNPENIQKGISIHDLSLGNLFQSSSPEGKFTLQIVRDTGGTYRNLIPASNFFSSLLPTSSSFSSIANITPLDSEYKELLIEQRIKLYETLQEALQEGSADQIQPLEVAIEDIDTLLRREFL